MKNFLEKVKNIWGKVSAFFVNTFKKCATWVKETATKINWKIVWDKTTTGLLIFLILSHLFILGYIFLWFYLRQMA
jgi:hypothetical protein